MFITTQRVTGVVLIVDDNPTNLSVLSQTLRNAGLAVRIAVDGESAIQQVQHKQPDLILLDVQMSGIDGFETCRRLKANSSTFDIPIIFITAQTDTASKTKGFALGAVDYIPKPFEQAEVLARVRLQLQLKHMTETLEHRVAERTAALEQAQIQLVQQEKLSTLGQLVAGIAHEMNNPIGCIVNNLLPAQEYIADLIKILNLYQQHCPDANPILEEAITTADLHYVVEDLPKVIDSIKVSAERMKDISVALRNFSRTDITCKQEVDLHQGIDSTLLILKHRLKAVGQQPEILVVKHYGNLPPVKCYPGQLNQVFMNILANAIDALQEAWEQNKLTNFTPTITIHTELLDTQYVAVRIADNGIGMAKEIQQQVFDRSFTTKPIGKGTGLGLAIARQIVEETHSGMLKCRSVPGEDTEFVIQLPLP